MSFRTAAVLGFLVLSATGLALFSLRWQEGPGRDAFGISDYPNARIKKAFEAAETAELRVSKVALPKTKGDFETIECTGPLTPGLADCPRADPRSTAEASVIIELRGTAISILTRIKEVALASYPD
jgi:hypothetical protein